MNEVATLMAQALEAFNAGDLRTAADRFERAATTLGATRRDDAVAAWESAARCRLMLEDPRRAAVALAKARQLAPDSPRVVRLNAEVIDQTGDVAARRAAWLAVAACGDRAQRVGAHVRLANLARGASEHAIAARHFESALAELDPNEVTLSRGELSLELAISKTALNELDAATAALDRADASLPDDDQGLRGRIIGQRGVLALAAGDLDRALALGEDARARAVARNDVMTYLGAASLVAMVHEQAARLVDAYDTYVRARDSLGGLLGEPGKELVRPAIQLFEARLGPEQFKQVWDAWVARKRGG